MRLPPAPLGGLEAEKRRHLDPHLVSKLVAQVIARGSPVVRECSHLNIPRYLRSLAHTHALPRPPGLSLCKLVQRSNRSFLSSALTHQLPQRGRRVSSKRPLCSSRPRCGAPAAAAWGANAGTAPRFRRWSAPPSCTPPACRQRRRQSGGLRAFHGCRHGPLATVVSLQHLAVHSGWARWRCGC